MEVICPEHPRGRGQHGKAAGASPLGPTKTVKGARGKSLFTEGFQETEY